MRAIDSGGVGIAFEERGPTDRPVLVLLHALGLSHSLWDDQAGRFAGSFHVVCPDLRGHGASDVPPGPYSVAALGGDVLAVIDALERAHGARPVHVCGISLGGMIALWLAVRHGARFRSATVACSAARGSARSRAGRPRMDAVSQGGIAAVRDTVLGRFFSPEFAARRPDVVARTGDAPRSHAAGGSHLGCCGALRQGGPPRGRSARRDAQYAPRRRRRARRRRVPPICPGGWPPRCRARGSSRSRARATSPQAWSNSDVFEERSARSVPRGAPVRTQVAIVGAGPASLLTSRSSSTGAASRPSSSSIGAASTSNRACAPASSSRPPSTRSRTPGSERGWSARGWCTGGCRSRSTGGGSTSTSPRSRAGDDGHRVRPDEGDARSRGSPASTRAPIFASRPRRSPSVASTRSGRRSSIGRPGASTTFWPTSSPDATASTGSRAGARPSAP